MTDPWEFPGIPDGPGSETYLP